jgi:hypothetical protein
MSDGLENAIVLEDKTNRRKTAALLWAMTSLLVVPESHALAQTQTPTPDPGAWRPVSYADLQRPSDATATYADIWRDAIEENNRAYVARGDKRFVGANAPATEAHFVIWSPRKSVVLSVLDTATGCTLKEVRAARRAAVRLCPLRIAIYEGVQVRTLDGGRACFLELAAPAPGMADDPNRAVAYAAYDVAGRTIKTGLVIDHQAIEGCSQNIPLKSP